MIRVLFTIVERCASTVQLSPGTKAGVLLPGVNARGTPLLTNKRHDRSACALGLAVLRGGAYRRPRARALNSPRTLPAAVETKLPSGQPRGPG